MSADADEKVQSKFPRASLRARNKTLMITPADIADFQTKSEKGGSALDHLDDAFGDALDAEVGTGDEMRSSTKVAQSTASSVELLEDSVDGLGDVWPSDSDDVKTDAAEKWKTAETDEKQELVGVDDIFAAPAEASPVAEELFAGLPNEPLEDLPDPIERTTVAGAGSFGGDGGFPRMLSASEPSRGAFIYSGVGASALQSAAQGVEKDSVRSRASHMESEYIEWRKPSKLVGFLVSYASEPTGKYVELREGRLLVTSESSGSDNCFVIAHESVSPMHAIMRISADGGVLILDQLSEHGTRIRRADAGKEEALMGDKSTLFHGDVVIFGECEYHVVVMGKAALKKD